MERRHSQLERFGARSIGSEWRNVDEQRQTGHRAG